MRFPKYSSEWITTKYDSVCKVFSGGTPKSSNKEYYKGDIPFIRSGEIHLDKTELFINEKALRESSAKMINKGDLLLALYGATSGEIDISRIEGAINQAILCIKTDQNKQFIKYGWESKVTKYLSTYLQGGQGNLSAEIFKSIRVDLTEKDEQAKIGYFLVLLDDRIKTQNKIIKEMYSLKKAIYFNSVKTASLKEVMVSDFCEIGRGRVISQQEIAKQESPKYPVFSSQTLNNGIMGYLDNYDFDGEYVTWTTDGANAGTVFYHNEKFNCTNVCGTLKVKDDAVLPYYLYIALSHVAKKYVSKNLGNPKLMNGVMGKITIKIPDALNQGKVVNCLKTFDELIANEVRLLDCYKKQKQYLLDNMFI